MPLKPHELHDQIRERPPTASVPCCCVLAGAAVRECCTHLFRPARQIPPITLLDQPPYDPSAEFVEAILQQSRDIFALPESQWHVHKQIDGITVLHKPVTNKSTPLMQLLIESTADPDVALEKMRVGSASKGGWDDNDEGNIDLSDGLHIQPSRVTQLRLNMYTIQLTIFATRVDALDQIVSDGEERINCDIAVVDPRYPPGTPLKDRVRYVQRIWTVKVEEREGGCLVHILTQTEYRGLALEQLITDVTLLAVHQFIGIAVRAYIEYPSMENSNGPPMNGMNAHA